MEGVEGVEGTQFNIGAIQMNIHISIHISGMKRTLHLPHPPLAQMGFERVKELESLRFE